MTEETGAAAPSAEPAAPSAPAESEQAKPVQSSAESVAAPEQAQTDQPEQADTQSADESEDRPKKPSRNDRMKRRMKAMATELDNLRAQLGANTSQSDKPRPPQESDFNGDYFAYQSAVNAYNTAQSIRSEFEAERTQREQRRMAELQAEMVQEFEERAEEYRARIPDFDATISEFVAKGGKFSQALVEELQSSEVGPALAYQIAKNPVKAAELSAMSPREVAREIGRLEASMSVPKPKTATKAPPPMSLPSGGAAKPQDLSSLAKSYDASAYIRARNEQEKARAKS